MSILDISLLSSTSMVAHVRSIRTLCFMLWLNICLLCKVTSAKQKFKQDVQHLCVGPCGFLDFNQSSHRKRHIRWNETCHSLGAQNMTVATSSYTATLSFGALTYDIFHVKKGVVMKS